MFFRRVRPHVPTFEEKLDSARQAGFSSAAAGRTAVRLSRDGFAADVDDDGIKRLGRLVGAELATLTDEGYQKFWITRGGRRLPALAGQLGEFHRFEEDLKEALGLESYYNESLGTRFAEHRYDRLENRDRGVPPRPWER